MAGAAAADILVASRAGFASETGAINGIRDASETDHSSVTGATAADILVASRVAASKALAASIRLDPGAFSGAGTGLGLGLIAVLDSSSDDSSSELDSSAFFTAASCLTGTGLAAGLVGGSSSSELDSSELDGSAFLAAGTGLGANTGFDTLAAMGLAGSSSTGMGAASTEVGAASTEVGTASTGVGSVSAVGTFTGVFFILSFVNLHFLYPA